MRGASITIDCVIPVSTTIEAGMAAFLVDHDLPGITDELRRLETSAQENLGDAAAAEDAAQDVLVKALSARSVPESVRPWLYRIARNHCLNLLRSRRVRAEQAFPSSAPFAESRTGHLTRLVRAENEAELLERVDEAQADGQRAVAHGNIHV